MTVTISTGSPPELILVRSESDPAWQSPDAADETGATFTFAPDGPYRITVACRARLEGTYRSVVQIARTLADDARVQVDCTDRDLPLHVRGTLAHPGSVSFLNATAFRNTGPAQFDLPARAVTAALVARSQDGYLAIRRDVQVSGDLELGSIDARQEGLQIQDVPFAIANALAGETVRAASDLEVGGTRASLRVGTTTLAVPIAPASLLRDGERNRVELTGIVQSPTLVTTRVRTLTYRIGDTTLLTLPASLGPVAFEELDGAVTAAWSPLPPYDELSVASGQNAQGQSVAHTLLLSRAFVEETGATRATLELNRIPGLPPAWQRSSGDRIFTVSSRAEQDEAVTSIRELAN